MCDAPVTLGWSGRFRLSLALLLLSACLHAATPLQIEGAWARPTPPGIKVGAVYFTLKNTAGKADRLLALTSPLAERVEIHQTQTRGGLMSMRAVGFLDCPPGQALKVSPGGLHVMLMGLKAPLKVGDQVPLNLKFRDAGMLMILVPVEAREE